VPLRAEQFDAVLSEAARDGLSHQQFLHKLIAEQADRPAASAASPTASARRASASGSP
jgi:hypothetical protein